MRLRRIIGWVHLYFGLVIATTMPVVGALSVVIGILWWVEARRA